MPRSHPCSQPWVCWEHQSAPVTWWPGRSSKRQHWLRRGKAIGQLALTTLPAPKARLVVHLCILKQNLSVWPGTGPACLVVRDFLFLVNVKHSVNALDSEDFLVHYPGCLESPSKELILCQSIALLLLVFNKRNQVVCHCASLNLIG